MKTAWIMRGMAAEMGDFQSPDRQKAQEQELYYLENALAGFTSANLHEEFPIAGMDEVTLDYLVAALNVKCGKYEEALKLLSEVITNRGANQRIKDKARDLKEEAQAMLKEESEEIT